MAQEKDKKIGDEKKGYWWKKQDTSKWPFLSKGRADRQTKVFKKKSREIKLSGVLFSIQTGYTDNYGILVGVRSKTAIKELRKNLGCKIKIIAKALPCKVIDTELWRPEEKKRRMLRIE